VVQKILNHKEQGVTAIYDWHGYDDEKRDAAERWTALLSNDFFLIDVTSANSSKFDICGLQ